MARVRAGTHAIRLAIESSFGTEPGSYDSNKLAIQCWGPNPNFRESEFENEAVMTDLGSHETGYGPSHDENECTFSTYTEGLGTAAGDASAAVATAYTHLHEISLGSAVDLSTGSTVKAATSPTTTVIEETDGGNHAVNTLIPFIDTNSAIHLRPCSAYATDEITLGLALPFTPSPADVIYGAANVAFAEQTAKTAYMEAIGKGSYENFEAAGCVGSFSFPEVEGNRPQTVDWTLKAASFTEDVSATQVPPANARPVAIAGGDYLIAAYGNTAGSDIDLAGWSFNLNREWSSDEAPNETDNIEGWTCLQCKGELTIYMKPDASTPTGNSASSYRDAFLTGGSENLFHILLQFGTTAGACCAYYFPKLRLIKKPERVERRGKVAQKLTFGFVQGANTTSEPFVMFAQA